MYLPDLIEKGTIEGKFGLFGYFATWWQTKDASTSESEIEKKNKNNCIGKYTLFIQLYKL